MIPINRTYAPVQALVEELARCGMTHAVTSPGSRNAPLALTLAAEPTLEAHSVIDERAAGFVALGIAKATQRPVAVTCTSGSAAANLMPAVVEAYEARVPLIVMTADRPPELREVGAGQSIDQIKLYGSHAKWFVEVGNHEPTRATAIHHRALACRAFWTALEGRPGPVHLNFPLREPLAPVIEELDPADWEGRDGRAPWIRRDRIVGPPPVSPDMREEARRLAEHGRGAIVCGQHSGDQPKLIADLASLLGWPLLADPISGARFGDHERSTVVAHYDVLLRIERFAAEHRPDYVLRFGDMPTSKPLRAWLEGVPQWVVDPHGGWHEPTRQADRVTRDDPADLAFGLIASLRELGSEPADPAWLESWRAADALVVPALDATPEPFEPRVWRTVFEAVPEPATVWVASSMPIRDVEAFAPSSDKQLACLSNRGANGIDGTLATAAGADLVNAGPTYVLIGDVALLHDIGGLLAARRLGGELTVVCANNGGGNIFDYLPVAASADAAAFEEHIVTPSGIELERVAALADMAYTHAASLGEVAEAVGRGPGLIEVPTERARNVELQRELRARVEAAL